MTTTVLNLAKLAQAVYTGATAPHWRRRRFRAAWEGLLSEGLQAAHYTQGGASVIAFRGTNPSLRLIGFGQDLTADIGLGLGMNTSYYDAAESFVRDVGGGDGVILCGHSLGGAVAQTVGNRMGLRFATFNAPGVAVWASRNMGEASVAGTAVRTAGMLVSALFHPWQAIQDMQAATREAHGLNVCLDRDPVSKIGVHYGQKVTLRSASTSSNPITQHGIDNVVHSLQALGIR
jgi:hypothetical protein